MTETFKKIFDKQCKENGITYKITDTLEVGGETVDVILVSRKGNKDTPFAIPTVIYDSNGLEHVVSAIVKELIKKLEEDNGKNT